MTLVASDREVRLLDGADVVARHERSRGKHQGIDDPEHRRALLEQKRAGRIPTMRDRLLAQVPGIDALYTRWVDLGRNVGLMTARTGKLLELYGADVLTKAVTDVLACGSHDSGALALRCEQARRAAGAPMPVTLELGAHVPDCEVITHNLGQYDRPRSPERIMTIDIADGLLGIGVCASREALLALLAHATKGRLSARAPRTRRPQPRVADEEGDARRDEVARSRRLELPAPSTVLATSDS